MSCRDLRNFTEMMRFLGYPRIISLSNFRVPNFPLVAEILIWLICRFDPDTDIAIEYKTVEDRVALIRRAAEFMAIKTNIKLNTKKLYQADGYAVHELLKIAVSLYEAQSKSAQDEIMSADSRRSVMIDTSGKLSELNNTQRLTSQLTVSGASLFDLLGREVQLGQIRNSKVVRQFDTSTINTAFREVIENTQHDIDDTRQQINNITETEQNLEVKIDRRRIELERNQKRLETLRKVRPAFMEEFEKLEYELRVVYDDYLHKCYYLAYLEHVYEDTAKAEQERFDQRQAATKRQLEQLRGEDANFESIMEGNDSIFSSNINSALILSEPDAKDNTDRETRTNQPIDTAAKSSRVQMNQRRIYGSMSGRHRGIVGETNIETGSLDSDSDIFIEGDLDDDDDDIDIDDDNEFSAAPQVQESIGAFDMKGNKNNSSTEKRSVSKIEHSDEDF